MEICDDILLILKDNLIASCESDDSKVFYYKM